jgi:hypothetical protein
VSQDDVAVLASALDARPDDHGTVNSPTPLSLTGVSQTEGLTEIALEGSGIIEGLNDKGFFSFWAGPGQFTVRADVPTNKVANLDVKLELWSNTGGNWTQVPIPSGRRTHVASDLWAEFWHPVLSGEVGEYRVAVKSNGTYGDLGQYQLKVTGEKVNDFSGPQVEGSIAHGPRKQFPLIARFATLYSAESLTVEFDRPILGNLAQAISIAGPSGPINVTAVQAVGQSDP